MYNLTYQLLNIPDNWGQSCAHAVSFDVAVFTNRHQLDAVYF